MGSLRRFLRLLPLPKIAVFSLFPACFPRWKAAQFRKCVPQPIRPSAPANALRIPVAIRRDPAGSRQLENRGDGRRHNNLLSHSIFRLAKRDNDSCAVGECRPTIRFNRQIPTVYRDVNQRRVRYLRTASLPKWRAIAAFNPPDWKSVEYGVGDVAHQGDRKLEPQKDTQRNVDTSQEFG